MWPLVRPDGKRVGPALEELTVQRESQAQDHQGHCNSLCALCEKGALGVEEREQLTLVGGRESVTGELAGAGL